MAGELKHGPLALVDDVMPLLMIVTRDPVFPVSCYSFYVIISLSVCEFFVLVFFWILINQTYRQADTVFLCVFL